MRMALCTGPIEARRVWILAAIALVGVQEQGLAQATPEQMAAILAQQVQSPRIAEYQLQQYLTRRVSALPVAASAQEWIETAGRLRKHLLEDVIFHGWPPEWVSAPLKFEQVGSPLPGDGYRMIKIRYEIIPGFQTTGILYEPADLRGSVPAILNVNGHVTRSDDAVEYKQKRCINYAKRGIVALSLNWLGYGELRQPENKHDYAAHLELTGASALGLFYLAMRKGLDFLYQHPHVDRSRLGMTGLSGGGWQSIVLGALDERVTAAVPVAGFGSLASNIVHPHDTSEVEEDATDLRAGQDYIHLTALRAPRPTLLIYNLEDTCCFRAPMVKPDLYDSVKPVFRLLGVPDAFEWHENADPGTHNYQLDNRIQSYRFFTKVFRLPPVETEINVNAEVLSYDDLVVGLPADNLTILGLARNIAAKIRRAPPADDAQKTEWAHARQEKLKSVVRYTPVGVKQAWLAANTHHQGVQTESWRFEFDNGLSATAVCARATVTAADAPVTLMIHDKGKEALGEAVAERVNRGGQVVAADLLFFGEASPEGRNLADFSLIIASTGDRPLGLEVAQLVSLGKHFQRVSGAKQVRLESTGMRSQLVALVASAIEPDLFTGPLVREGIPTLGFLLDKPVEYRSAPDLFCLDLYKEFDIHVLASLVSILREPGKAVPSGN